MLCSLEAGGAQAMIINVYKNIDKRKFHFDFVIDHQSANNALIPIVEDLGCKVYYLEQFNGFNCFQVVSSWKNFFKKHNEYDILHIHGCSYSSLFIPVAKKNNLKVIMHSHSVTNGKNIKGLISDFFQYPIRFQANFFLSCSKKSGEWAFGKRIVNGKYFLVIKNAIDTKRFAYNQAVRADYRSRYCVANKTVFVNVGRFHVAKNHSFLLKVFSKICRADKSAVLWLIGDGKFKKRIQKKVCKLEIADKVLFFDNRNDIPNILQAADCFLFPSKYEGLGIVAIEAQASDLFCICSNKVPNDVCLTSKCFFLPLREKKWVDFIANLNLFTQRKNVSETIVNAGYDMGLTCQSIENLYNSLVI